MSPATHTIVARSGWGAAAPERPLTRWNPRRLLGVTVHWLGAPSSRSRHPECDDLLRLVQRGHKARGFADIAYNHAVCRHGAVYALRGFDNRTGANGTTFANRNYAAVVVMVGADDPPTVFGPAAKDAAGWIVREWLRRTRERRVVRHSRWTQTRCPGPTVGAWTDAGGWRARPEPGSEERMRLPEWYEEWAWWYIVQRPAGTPRPAIAGLPATIPQWAFEHVGFVLDVHRRLGPPLAFDAWSDWYAFDRDPDTRPSDAFPRVPPEWWAGFRRRLAFAQRWDGRLGRELEQRVSRVADLVAERNVLLERLDQALRDGDAAAAGIGAELDRVREALEEALATVNGSPARESDEP